MRDCKGGRKGERPQTKERFHRTHVKSGHGVPPLAKHHQTSVSWRAYQAMCARSWSSKARRQRCSSRFRQLREQVNRFHHTPDAEALSTSRNLQRSTGTLKFTTTHDIGDVSSQQNDLTAGSEALITLLENLDFSALSISHLKLRAQPWTALAGDGLISELVSSFVACDNCFHLSLIDEECFVRDMQAGDIDNADFCTPLLVHAICALRCVRIVHCTTSLSLIDRPVHFNPC